MTSFSGSPFQNSPPVSIGSRCSRPVTRLLSSRLKSVDLKNYLQRRRTYPGLFPILHLDHIYYAGRVEIVGIELPRTRLALVASDHLPLVADIRMT